MVFALDNNTYVETILPTNVGNDSQKCNVFAKQVKFEDNTTLTTAPNTSYDETTRLGNNSSVGQAAVNLNASSKINSKSFLTTDNFEDFPAYSGSTDFANVANFTMLSHNVIMPDGPTSNIFNNTTASNNFAKFRNNATVPPIPQTSDIEVTFTLPSPIYGVTKIVSMVHYADQASINNGTLFTLTNAGNSSNTVTLYNSSTAINLYSIKIKRILNATSGSLFWNYIKVNDVLIVQNVNPSVDYRLYHRASIFSKIIYLPPVEEFTAGELGYNQSISHNTSTMLSLQLKTGLDQWGNGDYTIQHSGVFLILAMLTMYSSDVINKGELIIKTGSTVLKTCSVDCSSDDDMSRIALNAKTLVSLIKGDIISAHAFQTTSDSSAILAEQGTTELVIQRIGGFIS